MAVVVEVEIGSKQAVGSLNDLKTAATQLEDKLNNTQFGTAEFKRLSTQLKGVRNELKDFDAQLEGLDKEQRATALVDTFNGLVGAVGAVSSAFIAFGADSEKIENAEKKILGVMAVVNGLRDASNGLVAAGKLFGPVFTNMGDSIKAGFTAGATGAQTFKAALISTGIGAFIVGVGLLVANFDKLTGATDEAAKATEEAAEAQKKFSDAINQDAAKSITQLNLLTATINDTTLSIETRQAALDDLKKLFPAYFKDLKDEDILTGRVTIATDDLTTAIIKQARARALQGRIEENAKKQLETEEELLQAQLKVNEAINEGALARKTLYEDVDGKKISIGEGYANEGARIKYEEATEAAKQYQAQLTSLNEQIAKDAASVGELNKATDPFIGGGDTGSSKTTKDPLAEKRKELKSALDLALARNEAERAAALKDAKTLEERIAVEENYTKKSISLKEKYANDVYKNTSKEEQDKTALNAELKNLDNDRVAAETQTTEDLKTLADDRNEALKTRQESFATLSAQIGEEAANNVINALQREIDSIADTTAAGIQKLAQLKAQLIDKNRQDDLSKNEQAKNDRLAALQTELDAELALYKGNETKLAEIRAAYALQAEAVKQQTAANAVEINANANAQIVANDKLTAEQIDTINQARLASQLDLASAIGGSIAALGGLFEQGTAAAKAAALADIAIGTGVGFINALDIAQKSAKATGPAAAFAFPIFYATQIAAVLGAASRAKAILGAGGGTTPPPTPPPGPGGPPTMPNYGIAGSDQTGNNVSGMVGNDGGIIKTYVLAGDVTKAQAAEAKLQQKRRL